MWWSAWACSTYSSPNLPASPTLPVMLQTLSQPRILNSALCLCPSKLEYYQRMRMNENNLGHGSMISNILKIWPHMFGSSTTIYFGNWGIKIHSACIYTILLLTCFGDLMPRVRLVLEVLVMAMNHIVLSWALISDVKKKIQKNQDSLLKARFQ